MAKRPGQPSKYRKGFHPVGFIVLSKQGKSLTQIALAWDVNRDTIYEWRAIHKEFSDAVKKGKDFCEAHFMNIGFEAMFKNSKEFNLGMFIWLTKNMFKWSDSKSKHEEIGESFEERQLNSMSDEELERDL